MSFTHEDNEDKVNRELRETYDYDLSYFEFSLRNIKTFFNLIELKRMRAQFRKEIENLESEKRKLIKHIDDFLSNSGLWDEIQSADNPWPDERKVSYIRERFDLDHFFEKIEMKIRSHQKKIVLLNGFRMETEEKKKRIQYQTLISLVWFYSMYKGEVTNTQKFRDISELFSWFTDNKPELIVELFGERIYQDDKAIKLYDTAIKANYDRYIRNPSESQKVYRDLARSVWAESTSPVDE